MQQSINTRNSGRFAPFFVENLVIHEPSLGSREIPQKFGPDRFSRFDVYWIQTDKQTDTQTNQFYI